MYVCMHVCTPTPANGTLVYNFLPPGHETKSKSGAETRKRDSIQPCTTYPSCPHRGRCPSPPTRACLTLSKSVDILVEDARRSLSRSFLISRFDDDEKKSGARRRPVYERTRPRRENRTRSPREPKHATPQSCKSEKGRGDKGDGESDLLHHHHCCRPLPANNRLRQGWTPSHINLKLHLRYPSLCESFFVARRTVTPLANRTFIKSIKKDQRKKTTQPPPSLLMHQPNRLGDSGSRTNTSRHTDLEPYTTTLPHPTRSTNQSSRKRTRANPYIPNQLKSVRQALATASSLSRRCL